MSNLHHGNRQMPVGPTDGAGAFLILAGAVAAVVSAGTSIVTVFAASAFAGGALIVVVATIVLLAVQVWRAEKRLSPALVILALSTLWAAFAGTIIFDWHWLAFTPAAWVLNALFVGALVAGTWNKLKAWAKGLAALFAVALVTATAMLPRPPGGDGPLDTAEKWKIDVTVTDEADKTPLVGARALCGTVMQWENTLALADTAARMTGRDGRIETWEFDEDPRLKIVICNAWKNADDANAGYPAESQIVLAPADGGAYELTFALNENAHPDTSYLALDLSGTFENQPWYYLTFELWPGEPQGEVATNDGPQPLLRKSWAELHGGGITLSAADAANALVLRYHYEGPAGPDLDPPFNEIRTIIIGSIPAGNRKRIMLKIPAQSPMK